MAVGPVIITPDTIKDVIEKNRIRFDKIIFLDGSYVMPTREWVEKPFSQSFWQFLKQYDADKYIEESNDCDDFSVGAWNWARLCNRKSRHGIAVGLFTYVRDDGICHARCLSLCEDLSLHIYEPQAYKFSELTLTERWSCIDCII